MAKENYYELLQVHPRANAEVMHAAYKALLKLRDPNRPENKSYAQQINKAYHTIARPDLREQYDRSLFSQDGGEVFGSFRKLEQIAEGAFGRTFKGEHITLGEQVCIKDCFNVRPEYYPMLEDEARAMWELRHYEIPAIHDLVKSTNGSPVLIMSYVPGPTLEQVVEKTGPLDPDSLCWITDRVLNSLMFIHYKNVIHGDLKPQNIIVQPDQHTISIVDFGLSLLKPHAGTSSKGYTPIFAPPEEIAMSTLLPQSDFYSLGMTMIYALVGGDLHSTKAKEVPHGTPEPLCKFIRKLIVRDMMARPHWSKINLCEEIRKVRIESFGHAHSGMKPIPGLETFL
ncbi:MAG: protein kinase [Candidatus Sungbacteria bacterium]|nr:protein kinase [Candidatus Sungbacteria bacterium]